MSSFRRFVLVATVTAVAGACSPGGASVTPERSPLPTSTTSPSRPVPVATMPPTPTPPNVAARLGPAPNECSGPAPRPGVVAPAYGRLVGRKPLWAGFYARYHRDRQAFTSVSTPRRRFGFRLKVLWIMSPKQQEPVLVSGTNLESGTPLHFDIEDAAALETEASLDPALGGPGEDGWREFPSYLYFDRAGCFELHAEWKDGLWRLVFGFGRR
jgi:hypothetical protein